MGAGLHRGLARSPSCRVVGVSAVINRAPRGARLAALALVLACAMALASDGISAGNPTYRSHKPFAVGEIVVRFTDRSRLVRFPGQPPQPRSLLTVIRYPAVGDASRVDVRGAPPARSSGPFPLIVFGHGFNVTPAIYARLLQAWASAGYVVAAPIFPLGNGNAPGGADESDMVNQPADMSFVITRMLAADAAAPGTLSGLLDPREIAVSGQSDGGVTALATAYDSRYLDRRVDAAVILSGAEILGGSYFRGPHPPLLASQGTADVINLPQNTYDFFDAARAPKLLLRLLGAPHLGPYTNEQPQLGVVSRTTVAFFDRYLKHLPGARGRLWNDGDVAGVATLGAGP